MKVSHPVECSYIPKALLQIPENRQLVFCVHEGNSVITVWVVAWWAGTTRINHHVSGDWSIDVRRYVHDNVSVYVYNRMDIRNHAGNVAVPNNVLRVTHYRWALVLWCSVVTWIVHLVFVYFFHGFRRCIRMVTDFWVMWRILIVVVSLGIRVRVKVL
jgi:hypothetical protein